MSTVLIVDDKENIRSSLGTTFRLEGFQVETARTNKDALATVAAFRAMGVVIDGPANGEVAIEGVGLNGLQAPGESLHRNHQTCSSVAVRSSCFLVLPLPELWQPSREKT